MSEKITVEVCCGSLNDCLTAYEYHADRIELNQALELGGLTPSLGTLIETKKRVPLPVCCMVRPRKAGFYYTEEQFEVMMKDAELFLDHGADGIVFGFLNPDGHIDPNRTRKLADLALSRGKEAIFHKAFDSTDNLETSLKILIDCHITRVLTSGGAVYPDILSGCRLLGQLQDKYGDQIEILPGGGVREFNAQEVLQLSHTGQIHLTAKNTFVDPSTGCFRYNHDSQGLEYVATGPINLEKIMLQIRSFEKDPQPIVTIKP